VYDLAVLTRALRNVSRRKIRVVLVVIALGFSMAIMISIPSAIVANQAAAEGLSEDYNEILAETEEAMNKTLTLIECSLTGGFRRFMFPGAQASYLNESAIYDISSIEGVKEIVPFLEKTEGTTQTMERRGRTFEILVPDYTIVGVPLNSSLLDNYVVLPRVITEGRNLHEGDSGVVLLSSDNIEYFDAVVGDSVYISGGYFEVVGVYESSDPLELQKLYMDLSEAQAITNLEGQISKLDVYAEDQSYVDEIASTITSLYPELYITTYEERLSQLENTREMYESTLENAESTLSQMTTIAIQEVGIAFVATSLIVLFTMLYTVRERTQEIGVLKAIGFSNWSVMSQFMLEGIFMSLMAGVVGIVIGYVGAPFLTELLLPYIDPFGALGLSRRAAFPGMPRTTGTTLSQPVTGLPDPQILLLAFGVAVLLGALGSLYPAWRASRTSPMEALRHE
jgi:putative ABC transport system permease protein